MINFLKYFDKPCIKKLSKNVIEKNIKAIKHVVLLFKNISYNVL